ncbi:hypothetical protein, partial [Reyranella sp.]|uniref:hypothetical protein n=1 Tax=Reyranella sp. TaxID=1929291 RepID=UPI0040368442
LAMINVTDRSDVAVRLVPLKLCLRHGVATLVMLLLLHRPNLTGRLKPNLERVKGIEPSS